MAGTDLHSFLVGQLLVKLKADAEELRVFSQADFVQAAYYWIRRLILIQPGWMCRANRSTPAGPADLVIYRDERFQCLLQFECLLKTGMDNYFPADMLDGKMETLRQMLHSFEQAGLGRAYLFGLLDTADSWFFPSGGEEPPPGQSVQQAAWNKQSCFWVPLNCREFKGHPEWRRKWEGLAAI